MFNTGEEEWSGYSAKPIRCKFLIRRLCNKTWVVKYPFKKDRSFLTWQEARCYVYNQGLSANRRIH